MNRYPDISGVILVGGKSRRMGRDKAFLQFDGKPLFERVLAVFQESFDRVLLVGDRAERFEAYSLPVLPDIYPGSSLGGLYTGLFNAGTEYSFVASCDLPFANTALLRYLCSLREGHDAVVPVTAEGYEPLFALYGKSCLAPVKANLENGNYCAYSFYPQVRVRYVTPAECDRFDLSGTAFVNLNTPGEFTRAGGKL